MKLDLKTRKIVSGTTIDNPIGVDDVDPKYNMIVATDEDGVIQGWVHWELNHGYLLKTSCVFGYNGFKKSLNELILACPEFTFSILESEAC